MDEKAVVTDELLCISQVLLGFFFFFFFYLSCQFDDCDCVTLSVIPIGCSPYDKGEIIHPICSDPAENDVILVSITIETILQSRFIEYFSNCGQLKTSDYKLKKTLLIIM